MNQNLKTRVDLFVQNTNAVKKEYLMPHPLVKQMAALLYTVEGRRANMEDIRACHDMIKKNTGVFSSFRGNLALVLSAMLALGSNPEITLENSVSVHKMMKQAGFIAADALTVAAFEIATKADPRNYEAVVERARAFYKGMRRNNWWVTGEDDYIAAAMLALTDMDVETGVVHMQELHTQLKRHMRNTNSIQALCQVMAVGGAPEQSAARVLELRDATKAAGIRMDRQYTLSSLGILALLPGSAGEIAEEIKEVYEYLRRQRGFSIWTHGQQPLLLLAGALVSSLRAEQAQSELVSGNLTTNFTNIILAEQMAMIIAVIVTSTALSSSGSSSGS